MAALAELSWHVSHNFSLYHTTLCTSDAIRMHVLVATYHTCAQWRVYDSRAASKGSEPL
jgi:hypothetical protein